MILKNTFTSSEQFRQISEHPKLGRPQSGLRDGICKLHDDPAHRRRKGENVRTGKQDQFSAKVVYGRMAEFFETVAGDRRMEALRG